MPRAIKEKDMDVSIGALKKAILDFDAYPEFLSEVKTAKTRPGATPAKTLVDFEIEVIRRFAYTLEFDSSKANEIHWRLHEGKIFTKNEGRWVLQEKGANQTHATYELELGLTLFVPGWVTKKLTENNLPRLLESYEERARTLK